MPKLLVVTTIPMTLRAFMLPYADHFRARGWRVDAMANGAAGCGVIKNRFDRAFDAPWSRAPLTPRNLWTAPRLVRELVEREGYDLVHVHTPVAAFVTRWALRDLRRRGGVRVIYTAHGFHFHDHAPPHRNPIYRALERVAAAWTDRLLVINQEDARSAFAMMPAGTVHHVPGVGVDPANYHPLPAADRARVRAAIGVERHQPLFLAVAELIPRKRHGDILRAFAALDRPDAVLALAGDGPLNRELRALARELGIADRVRFLGWRDDVADLVASAEALVLASAQEGLPRSVLEAMAAGVPAIGSDIRGTRDLLEGGRGLLFPVADVPAATAAMRRVLDEPETMAAIAERARRAVADHALGHVLAMHEAIYDEVLAPAAHDPAILAAVPRMPVLDEAPSAP